LALEDSGRELLGPVRHGYSIHAGVFLGGQLHREVAHGRAFDCAAAHFKFGRAGRQPVEKGVTAATAYDINSFELLSRDACKVTHNFSILDGQAMENEIYHLWSSFGSFLKLLQSALLELSIDARRHFPGNSKSGSSTSSR
jgi:hypothetical protein